MEVRLVTLDLRAFDRGGDPVTDLEAGELSLEYEGRELEIAFLEPVKPQAEPDQATIELAALPGAPSMAQAFEPNRGGRRVLVLFDLLSILERDLPSIRRHVARHLVDDASEDDLIGFATAEADFRMRVVPTTRREALLAALAEDANFERPGSHPLPGVFRDIQMDRIFRPVTRGAGSYLFDDRRCEGLAIASLESIRTAIDLLSPLPGRKELVYVSEGFSLACQDASLQDELRFDIETPYRDNEENDPRYRYPVKKGHVRYRVNKEVMHSGIRGALDRVLSAAARAGVSIVTIHPASSAGRAAYQSPSLNALARHSGGTHLAGGGVRSALERAVEAREAHYELGYYLPSEVARVAPREIELESARRGVRLLVSRGRTDDPPLRQWEDGALRFGRPKLVSSDDEQATWTVPLVVDPATFRFVPAGEGLERARFSLALDVVDEAGRPLGEMAMIAWIDRSTGRAEASEPARYVAKVRAPRGEVALRARLSEPDGGAICRRETRLPAPSAPGETGAPGEPKGRQAQSSDASLR